MKLSRPSRFVAALVTLFSLLFTQLAVASYACPTLKTAGASVAATTSGGDMAGCQGLDAAQPSLCKAHCDTDRQSANTPAAPQVAPFVAAALTIVLPEHMPQVPTAAWSDAPRLTRTTAPPLAIRNCCFRI